MRAARERESEELVKAVARANSLEQVGLYASKINVSCCKRTDSLSSYLLGGSPDLMWGYGQDWLPQLGWTMAKAESHQLSADDCASFSREMPCSVRSVFWRAYPLKLLNQAASTRSAVMCASAKRCFVEQQL